MGKRRSRKEVKEYHQSVKVLYENGMDMIEIAKALGVSYSSVHNTLVILGLHIKKRGIDESKLIYADNRVILKKLMVNGKRYTDVTPVFAPR